MKTGDIVIDDFSQRKGIVMYETKQKDSIYLLIKRVDVLTTLESFKSNWRVIGHIPEFENVLKVLNTESE